MSIRSISDAQPPVTTDRSSPRGFTDPAHHAQATFRAVLTAMSEPGRIVTLPRDATPPQGLSPAMAAILLALADFETPVWLDHASPDVARFLRFETGCPLVTASHDAALAVVTTAGALPAFTAFNRGTLDYPDRGATVLIEVADLDAEGPFRLTGPGIAGEARLGVGPLPADFAARMAVNRAGFPLGVDLVLTCADRIAALPRSVTLLA